MMSDVTHRQMQATRKTRRMTRMAEQTAMMTRLWKVSWMPAPVSRIRMFSQLSNSEPESQESSDSQGGLGGGGSSHRGGGHEEGSSQSSSRYKASLQAESRLYRSVSGSSIII